MVKAKSTKKVKKSTAAKPATNKVKKVKASVTAKKSLSSKAQKATKAPKKVKPKKTEKIKVSKTTKAKDIIKKAAKAAGKALQKSVAPKKAEKVKKEKVIKTLIKAEKKASKKASATEKQETQKEVAVGKEKIKSKGAAKEAKKKASEVSKKDDVDLDLDIFEDGDFGGPEEDFDTTHLMEEEEEERQRKILSSLSTISSDFDWTDIRATIANLDFFSEGELDECQEKACENLQAIQGFCRLHYIKNWKTLKRKRSVVQEGKLQNYVEELVKKFPLEYLEEILKDLKDEREFYKVLKDLNIDNNFNVDESDALDDDSEDIVVETRSISDSRANLDDEDAL